MEAGNTGRETLARNMIGQNLTYAMLDALGKEIVTGVYDDRPFPTEAELARRHEVSRSVTREAVKMLTAKGLLTARPRTVEPVRSGCAALAARPEILAGVAAPVQ